MSDNAVGTFSYRPVEDYTGLDSLIFSVTDGVLSDTATVLITLTAINDAPVAENVAISPSIPLETDDLILSYLYTDIENDPEAGTEITWFMNGVEQESFVNSLVVPYSATNCGELWYAFVTPSDGIDIGQPVQSNRVTICGSNSPPVWSEIDPVHILEDSEENSISMIGLITDSEQSLSQITFTVSSNSDSINLDAQYFGSVLMLTPLIENYFTIEPITLELTADDGEYIVSAGMEVYIDPVNDSPVLSGIGDQVTDEDTDFTIELSAFDVDLAVGGQLSLIHI